MTVQFGFGGFGEGQEVGGVPIVHEGPVAGLPQPLQGVLPDGGKQPEPRLVTAGFRVDQTAFHEGAEAVDRSLPRARRVGASADRLRRRQAERAREDSQARKQRLLTG